MEGFGEDVLPESHPHYNRVARVATKILKSNMDIEEVKKQHWTISVIAQTEQNAFVLPVSTIVKLRCERLRDCANRMFRLLMF